MDATMSEAPEPNPQALDPPQVVLSVGMNTEVTLQFSGDWRVDAPLPLSGDMQQRLADIAGLQAVAFDSGALTTWDSGLVAYLAGIIHWCTERGVPVERAGLPEGVRALLKLAFAVPERTGARREEQRERFLERIGNESLDLVESTGEIMGFIGESVLAFRRLLAGKARFRPADMWLIIQEVGADALPIVSLVSFLVGLILAYIAQQQLAQFGAGIYVANLVGLAMVIQMGALITAIVMAGRTGAAFAAQLGTMQVNEEIDALRTLGISPMEFLVLPRMMALMLMTPLLAIYANLMGILGGALVSMAVGGLTSTEYFGQIQGAVGLNHVTQGLVNATAYGAIIAVSGCLRGMQCGRSAASVGLATTSAVVTAIVFIVIAAAVLTILFNALGF
jgi:phospholipid/cholesterol/gamma-HCH transport system permease protein